MNKKGFAFKNLIILIALAAVVVLTVHFIKKKGSKIASITNLYNNYLQGEEIDKESFSPSLAELIQEEGASLVFCVSEIPKDSFVEEVTEEGDLIHLKVNYLKDPITIKAEKEDSIWRITEINCPVEEEIDQEEIEEIEVIEEDNDIQEQEEIAPVKIAKEDLSLRLKIDKSKIELKSLDSVIFSDSTLGVSAPGEVYNQTLTSGYVILLSLNDQIYRYHADNQKVVFIP